MSVRATSSSALRLTNRRGFSLPPCARRSISQKTAQHQECDVVIVGGGPAGLALASALGASRAVREFISVTLVEAGDLSKVRDWTPSHGMFSNRVSSITNASQRFLTDVGAWSHMDDIRTCPVQEMQAWDGISDARISFNASDLNLGTDSDTLGSTQMARLTENLNLQRGLLRHLAGIPEIQVLEKVKVTAIIKEDRGGSGAWPLVHLSDGTILRARLLVGADGFNSPVRSYAGITSYGWSYDTQAIVATLQHPPRSPFQSPNTIAYQRFLPTGPIAFLPLSPTVSSLVWSTRPPLASVLLASDSAVLVSMINAAFRLPDVSVQYLHNFLLSAQEAGQSLTSKQVKDEITWREWSHAINKDSAYASASSDVLAAESIGIPAEGSGMLPPLVTAIQTGTVASFPLRFNHVNTYIGEGAGNRTVLVGDAAHTIHPLAGQGLNMGLGDVESLARCIQHTIHQGGDIGSWTALLPYTRERYFENHKLMSTVDKLHRLYSLTFEPLVWARSVGLEVVNEFDSLKAVIMVSAGALGHPHYSETGGKGEPATGWDSAARGVEGLAGVVNPTKVVGEGLIGVVGARLKARLKQFFNATKTPGTS